MPEAFALSAQDRKVIQEIIDVVRRDLVNTPSRPGFDWVEHQAPEFYIAKTPSGGIDAAGGGSSGGSSGSGSGAGAASGEPGCAFCDIYKLSGDPGAECEYSLVNVGLTRNVYNVYETAIDGNTFVPVARDKYGFWFALSGGGGGGAPETRFVKCKVEDPTDGRYDAVLMDEQSDGTLTESTDSVWLREGNLTPKLFVNEVYHAKITGEASGRDVWMTTDYNLIVRNYGGSISLDRVFRILLRPDDCWDLSSLGESRRAVVKRKVTVERSDGTMSFGPDVHTIQLHVPDHWKITQPSDGVVRIRPDRATTTRQVCEGDGVIRNWEFIHGLLVRINGNPYLDTSGD